MKKAPLILCLVALWIVIFFLLFKILKTADKNYDGVESTYAIEKKESYSRLIQDNSKLIDIEFNGHKHEFVYTTIGVGANLAHWPDCKYCNGLHE